MPHARRIFWGEGMLLMPQHFQQASQYHEHALASRFMLTTRHGWGLHEVGIDEATLASGLVQFDSLALVFRDGTLYRAPGVDALPACRDLNSIPRLGTRTTLYACLAQLQSHGGNVRSGETAAQSRFRTAEQEVADLFGEALEARLTTLELDVRLMVEEENRDGFDCLPICQLEKDATSQWRVAADFLPPLISVACAPRLGQMLRRLLETLLVKSQSLSGVLRERSAGVMESGPADVGVFWLLHSVNRSFARLNHLARTQPVHPETLFEALSEFAGELLTFSSQRTLADIPHYQHEAPWLAFSALDALLRQLLETVISARHAVIPLHSTRPSFHVGRLESERVLEGSDFYLSVSGDLPASEVLDNVPLKLKIGAPDDVEKILHSATRGVLLHHVPQPPSALPVRLGNLYFALESGSAVFQRMLASRSVCIYLPQTLSGLNLELIAVFR